MNQSAICIAGAHRSGTSMLTRLLQAEDVRSELAFRRGDEIHHREHVARFQKTIEAFREVLLAKSVSAAAETNRRDSCMEELQIGPVSTRCWKANYAGESNSWPSSKEPASGFSPEARNQTTKITPEPPETPRCYPNDLT